MQIHKSCPECSARILADSTSCRCGWSASGAAKSAKQVDLCGFNDHGMPCRHRGILSLGTGGTGPWYCREHFERINGRIPTIVGNALPEPVRSHEVRERRAAA